MFRDFGREDIEILVSSIEPVDGEVMEDALKYQDALIKPPGSLGTLEDISVRLAGITGNLRSSIEKTGVAIFSSDNGVVAQGVASASQEITFVQTVNFTRKVTGVGSLAKTFGVDLLVTDVGGAYEYPEEFLSDSYIDPDSGKLTELIVDRKITRGTRDLAVEPAMGIEDVYKALGVGVEVADVMAEAGYDVIGIGEMGIGNTSTSAAVLSYLTGCGSDETVGKGGGVNKDGFLRKKEIVDTSIRRIETKENKTDQVCEVLRQVGGYDIAAMTGTFIGAAANRVPVVIDGYISAVAALCASIIAPEAKSYMFASHQSKEPGYLLAMRELGLTPMFDLKMRLGEGSGCPIAFQIMKAACGVINGMGTFADSGVDTEYRDVLDRKEDF